jgi:magnesium-transporting ATPase (P-type)
MGDPMEAAMDACATRLGIDVEEDRRSRAELVRFPFDAIRKRMSSVLHSNEPGELAAVVVKGAVDGVLSLCPDDDVAASCREEADSMSRRGMRVIAVAQRRIPVEASLPSDASDAEADLTLLGLIGFLDPPRPSAFDAVMKCRRAGIKVGMITGDDPHTAFAIGELVGLVTDGARVLLGNELPTDIDALGALVDHDGVIISRATPEDKLRIAQALRARGHVVAMTGDGVNDGPALRAASIGVAMGRSGTDVAREAADIVLLDDDFATIVEAIAQGRATFWNVERFLTYHLTDNVAELTPFVLWAASGGRLPLALTVMQVLALDIGTDTTSATALGAEPPSPHVLDGPPVSGHLLSRRVAVRAFGLLGPTESVMSMSAFFVSYLAAGWRPGDSFAGGPTLYAASGAAFLAVVLGQKANAWACRSTTLPPWRLGWFGNKLLVFTAIGEMAFAAACLGVRPIADALEHRFPPLIGGCVAVASIPAVLLTDSLWKRRQGHWR